MSAGASKLLRGGVGALLLVLIMFVGSLVLWIGTPLLWLWVGSQFEGATDSLGGALVVMFLGILVTIWVLAVVLSRLSNIHRANAVARGHEDPGHAALERVLVASAAVAVVAFGIWFVLFAGAGSISLGPSL